MDNAPSFNWKSRILLLLLNYIPLLHALSLVAILVFVPWSLGQRCLAFLAALYLLPPLLQLPFAMALRRGGNASVSFGSSQFFCWWISLQLQVIFNRLHFLEEGLRLVPGLYSLWLRLWGARIGRLTYWASEVRVLDRGLIDLGDDVVFGAGVRINPHVMAREDAGPEGMRLQLGVVKIGDRAVVGGYSLLTAGTEIADDECTRAFLISPPFSKWKNGKRLREE